VAALRPQVLLLILLLSNQQHTQQDHELHAHANTHLFFIPTAPAISLFSNPNTAWSLAGEPLDRPGTPSSAFLRVFFALSRQDVSSKTSAAVAGARLYIRPGHPGAANLSGRLNTRVTVQASLGLAS
jgi:hypothetical protein